MTQRQIGVSRFPCLNTPAKIEAINKLLGEKSDLMPHQIANATGCSPSDSLAFLQKLYALGVAVPYLLVYHNIHTDDPLHHIAIIPIENGMPNPPFECDECAEEVEDSTELSYDFLFLIDRAELPVVVMDHV